MKTIKITIGALAALVVVLVAAATASATLAPLSKFVATPKVGKTFPLQIKGTGIGPQEFTFKKLKIKCAFAKVRGEVTSPESESITLTVKFNECEGGPFAYGNIQKETLPVKFKEKALLTYSYAGWLESGEEVEMLTRPLKCVTDWEEGTYPEKAEEAPEKQYFEAAYKTEEVANANEKLFPSGKQKKLLVTNEIGKGIEWGEEGEGVCETFKVGSGERGKYFGKLLVEVPNGNLEFKEPVV